jgi:uncharacterized protein YqfA (UPF0365 family)
MFLHNPPPETLPLILLALLVFALIALFFVARMLLLWLQMLCSGIPIPLLTLISMRLRGSDVRSLLKSFRMATKSGFKIPLEQLEAFSLSEGNVVKAVQTLIADSCLNHPNRQPFSFDEVAKADLEGKDLLKEIQSVAKANLHKMLASEKVEPPENTQKSEELEFPFVLRLGMRLRGTKPKIIRKAMKALIQANIPVSYHLIGVLEAHYMAGGNIEKVVEAFILAHKASLSLTIQQLMQVDLIGGDMDVVEALKKVHNIEE